MTTPRLSDVFLAALKAPAADRAALVRARCQDHPEWIPTIELLVAASERAPSTAAMGAAVFATPSLPPGSQVGPYVVDGELGRGGMGIVYRARDVVLDMAVALKAVRPEAAGGTALLGRLQDEARTLARLSSNPHIARVYAFVEQEDTGFIVQELLSGETLRDRLTRGPVAPADGVDIMLAALDALAAAHRAGIVHRDLKPENVMRTDDGMVKVLDFGIALRREVPPEGTLRTHLSARLDIAGTIGYMAPEQLLGQPVDARTDLFAAGVVLYELLTGRHPFGGASEETKWSAILVDPPAALTADEAARIPEALMRVIDRCLRKVPAERWQSAESLAEAMRGAMIPDRAPAAAIAAGEASVERPVRHATASAVRWWQFHQVAAAVIAWLLLIPVWQLRDWITAFEWRFVFFLLLAALAVAPSLRLSLAFVSSAHPSRLRDQVRRCRPWIRAGEMLFSAGLLAVGLALAGAHAGWATLFIAFGIGMLVVAWFVEPVTEAAALEHTEVRSSEGGGRS